LHLVGFLLILNYARDRELKNARQLLNTLLVLAYLKIATTKIKHICKMTLKTAKEKMVIKIPAFEMLEKVKRCTKSFKPSVPAT